MGNHQAKGHGKAANLLSQRVVTANTTKQPISSATHLTTAKVMKGGSKAIESKLRKIQTIDANSYKCDNVECAFATRMAAFEAKLAKTRGIAMNYKTQQQKHQQLKYTLTMIYKIRRTTTIHIWPNI